MSMSRNTKLVMWFVAVAAFCLLPALMLFASQPLPSSEYPCKIIEICSADTVTVELPVLVRVPLDCVAPSVNEECGPEALTNLKRQALNQPAMLYLPASQLLHVGGVFHVERGYGRVTTTVDKLDVAKFQIRSGFASPIKSPVKTICAQQMQQAPGWNLNSGFDASAVEGPEDFREPDWSAWIATQAGLDPRNVCEVRTRSGKRVDILTGCEAIEVEWVAKWYEAIGQAGLYSIETGRAPAIILLSRSDSDASEILRCQAVCAKFGIRLYVQRVPSLQPNPIEKIPAKIPPNGQKVSTRFRIVSAGNS